MNGAAGGLTPLQGNNRAAAPLTNISAARCRNPERDESFLLADASSDKPKINSCSLLKDHRVL